MSDHPKKCWHCGAPWEDACSYCGRDENLVKLTKPVRYHTHLVNWTDGATLVYHLRCEDCGVEETLSFAEAARTGFDEPPGWTMIRRLMAKPCRPRPLATPMPGFGWPSPR